MTAPRRPTGLPSYGAIAFGVLVALVLVVAVAFLAAELCANDKPEASLIPRAIQADGYPAPSK